MLRSGQMGFSVITAHTLEYPDHVNIIPCISYLCGGLKRREYLQEQISQQDPLTQSKQM